MIKKKFQFYKNIILVVASALTLVAVTFAWFSTSHNNGVPGIQSLVGNELISVNFFESKDNGSTYAKMNGDIDLENVEPGQYAKYKMEVATYTKDPIALSFAIDNLPADMPQELKDEVCIKYTLHQAAKNKNNGKIEVGQQISASTGYVPLSELNNGAIFGSDSFSLKNYQTTANDYFVIFYEIGLSDDATRSSGLESSLGNIRLSAQAEG